MEARSPVELSVVIVNWNSKDYVRKCLHSLSRHHAGSNLEVIVVDGASFDGCDNMLTSEFPSAHYIQSATNVGFAKANNLGVRKAAGPYVLFLNPDTEFIEDSVSVLLGLLKSLPMAGAVGCRLLNEDRSVQTSCVQAFPTALNRALDSELLRRMFPRWKCWGMRALQSNEPAVVDAISGACILMPRQLFDEIGGFTEAFFMYGEDVDLCFKIGRAGRHVYYVGQTSLVHFGGGSSQQSASNFSNVMFRESTYRFLKRNRGAPAAIAFRLAMMASAVARLIALILLLPFGGGRGIGSRTGSLRKWFFVLRWGLGLESWVADFPAHP